MLTRWLCVRSGCEICVLNNQTALGKAGCTPAEETGYCAAPAPIPPPPPLSCTHTDSRGDSYDLSGIPRVDQLAKTFDGRPSWYHVGICAGPTQDASDPTKGCLPPCQNEPGSDCSGAPHRDGSDAHATARTNGP